MADIRSPRHLGDGVYASFDGYHINLAVNHHENHVIALEPGVLKALDVFKKEIDQQINEKSRDTTEG